MTLKIKRLGRKGGGQNKGYFYRSGRGWYASDLSPLRDETGFHRREQNGGGKTEPIERRL